MGRNTTPAPLSSFVLQSCSFGSHYAGWVTRSVSISIIPPYKPVVRFRGLCFCVQHAQTAEDLLPSSVVEAPTATVGYNFTLHRKRYSPTLASQREEYPTTKGQRAKCFSCLYNRCVCIVRDGVQMVLPVGSHTKCLQVWVCLNIGPTTIEFEVSTLLCDEHVCGDSSPYCIRNNLTFKVPS